MFRKDKKATIKDEVQSAYKNNNNISYSHHENNLDPTHSTKIFTGTFLKSNQNDNYNSKYISDDGYQINQNKKNIFNNTSSYIIK